MDQADVLDKFDHWHKDHPEGFRRRFRPCRSRTVCPKAQSGRYTLFVLVATIAVWLFAAGGIGQITVWLSPAEVARNGSEPIESEPLLPALANEADSELVESESAPVEEPVPWLNQHPSQSLSRKPLSLNPKCKSCRPRTNLPPSQLSKRNPRSPALLETESLLPVVAEAVSARPSICPNRPQPIQTIIDCV